MGRKKNQSTSDKKVSSRNRDHASKPRSKQSNFVAIATPLIPLLVAVLAIKIQTLQDFARFLRPTVANASSSKTTTATTDQNVVCTSEGDCPSTHSEPPLGRPLRPSDLPEPIAFTSFGENTTVSLSNGIQQKIAPGSISQVNNFNSHNDVFVNFAVLTEAVNRSAVEDALTLLRGYKDWDDDPDTVDGMTSHEMFLWSPDLYQDSQSIKYRDVDSKFTPARKELRKKLSSILKPYLDNVITPMVHRQYPKACTSKGHERYCTPCYGLIRKYKHGQRQSHATHYDGHAIVTVVVSLSDYNADYRGGLYISTGFGQREHVALNKGDAIMHQSSLLHGVKVYDIPNNPSKTERWSWIMWYRDSDSCEDYGHEWFVECAEAGDPHCQHLDSTKVGNRPDITPEKAAAKVLELNMRAADGGNGISAVKIARAYMNNLPSTLPYDMQKAVVYYHKAIESHNPDGHFGMAMINLMEVTKDYSGGSKESEAHKDNRVDRAIAHLEEAAYAGHAFSMFNLGIAHTFGYTNGTINADLAGQWFEESGLPEGYAVAASQAAVAGNRKREKEMLKRAQDMGAFAPWRTLARQKTGSGGASGVDLNLPWPPAFDGRRPPEF